MIALHETARRVDVSTTLKRAGLQAIAQRLAVYRAVRGSSHAMTDEICEKARAGIGALSRQVICDALNAMSEHGPICPIHRSLRG